MINSDYQRVPSPFVSRPSIGSDGAFIATARLLGLPPHTYFTAEHMVRNYGSGSNSELLKYVVLHLMVQDDSGHLCSYLDPERFLCDSRLWSRLPRTEEGEHPHQKELDGLLLQISEILPELLKEHPRLFGFRDSNEIPFLAPDSPETFYLQRNYREERCLIDRLHGRLAPGESSLESFSASEIQRAVEQVSSLGPFHKNPEPLFKAVETALRSRLMIISGGPGTGKTTLVTYLLRCLYTLYRQREGDLEVAIAAPTGRAAMRVKESISQEQQRSAYELDHLFPGEYPTLHRLLGLHGGRSNRPNPPLLSDVIIVDEASMVDLSLMNHLFARILPGSLLILVGDRDQLPSVEAGALLGDFLYRVEQPGHALGKHVLILDRVYRSGTAILDLAVPVKNGDVSEVLKRLASLSSETMENGLFGEQPVSFGAVPSSFRLPSRLLKCFDSLLEKSRSFNLSVEEWPQKRDEIDRLFNIFSRTGILSPLRKGPFGCEALNGALDHLVSGREGLPYHGRPVMITGNLYNLRLFNGDRGLVLNFHGEHYLFFKSYEEGYRYLPYARVSQLETSYVQTIHKSQGSEFDRVVVLLPPGGERLATREILYTGMTRAKEQLTLLGDSETVKLAVSRRVIRNSRLRSAFLD